MLSPTFELDQQDGLVVATVSTAYVTHPEMQELMQLFMERMRHDGATQFVLDLGAVSYLSSACLGEMVAFLQDLEHVRGRIALANCRNDVAFLFKVTRLDHVFPMFDDVLEARLHVRG